MSIAEYVKGYAGRWFDRNFLPPVEPPSVPAEPVVFDPDSSEDGPGMWRGAVTLGAGEQVFVAGRWMELERDPWRYEGRVQLAFVGGGLLGTAYAAKVFSRDRDEIAEAQALIGGAK